MLYFGEVGHHGNRVPRFTPYSSGLTCPPGLALLPHTRAPPPLPSLGRNPPHSLRDDQYKNLVWNAQWWGPSFIPLANGETQVAPTI